MFFVCVDFYFVRAALKASLVVPNLVVSVSVFFGELAHIFSSMFTENQTYGLVLQAPPR